MGQRVLSIRGVGCNKSYPYYAVGIYEARPRRIDGVMTWRLIGNYTRPCRSKRPEFHGVVGHPEYRAGIRHGTKV